MNALVCEDFKVTSCARGFTLRVEEETKLRRHGVRTTHAYMNESFAESKTGWNSNPVRTTFGAVANAVSKRYTQFCRMND